MSPRVSVGIPVYNEEAGLPELLAPRPRGARRHSGRSARDRAASTTAARTARSRCAEEAAAADPRIVVVSLSRNFGHQAALSAALDHATGDVVVVMDGDLQDPPEAIPRFLEEHARGYDVVYARRVEPQGGLVPPRRVLDLLPAASAGSRRSSAAARRGRLRPDVAPRRRPPPEGPGAQPVPPRTPDAGSGSGSSPIPSSAPSATPARASTASASSSASRSTACSRSRPSRSAPRRSSARVAIVAAILFAALLASGRSSFLHDETRGFTALTLLITFLSGVNLFFLGVIGEYVGRVYEEVKGRPLYVVSKVVEATVNCLRQTRRANLARSGSRASSSTMREPSRFEAFRRNVADLARGY